MPAGWTEHATASGQAYFYNAATGTSTYERPTTDNQNISSSTANAAALAEAGNNVATALVATTNGAGKKEKRKRKEKPVQKVQIQGTPWMRVTTSEGNTFYTNTETKTSVWTVPDEIKEQVAVLDRYGPDGQAAAQAAAAAQKEAEAAAKALQEKEAEMERLRKELEEEREASRKRKLQEEAEAGGVDTSAKRARVENEDDAASDVEQQPEEDEQPQLEEWQLDELQAKADMEAELAEPAVSSKSMDLSSEESVAIFKVGKPFHISFTALIAYTGNARRERHQPDAAVGYGAAQIHRRPTLQSCQDAPRAKRSVRRPLQTYRTGEEGAEGRRRREEVRCAQDRSLLVAVTDVNYSLRLRIVRY